MLLKILKMLISNKKYSKRLISKELGISENMVEQMIIQLKNMGYLDKDDGASAGSSGCSCCSAKDCCSSGHNMLMNMWHITEKGRKVVERLN